jgi:two-component system chemotaxis sensor kinase CheA
VGGLGSVSLPLQGDNDTMIKIGSETVGDHRMYQRLFDLMEKQLDPFATLDDKDAATPEDKKAAARPAVSTPNAPRAAAVTTVAAPVLAPGQVVAPGQTVMVLVPMQTASAAGPAEAAASAPAASASAAAPASAAASSPAQGTPD